MFGRNLTGVSGIGEGWEGSLFVLFIIMGQNSSFHLSITDVIKEWAPISKDSPIFVNRNTRQHLQRFIVQVSLPELLREVTIYNARIQAVYPFICRVAYFNQVPSDDEHKGFRSFAVYTDHLMPIREGDWTLMRFVQALEAVLTLTGYYGFFKLTEGMMRVNERGEVKVWISDCPANNHRDIVLTTEEQALATFAGLAARKNYQVANLLIGCASLQQAMERLKRPRRKTSTPYENIPHYVSEDREMGRKEYKNVFNESNKGEIRTMEPILKAPGSSLFSAGRKEQFKPFSYGGKTQTALSGRTTSQYKKGKPSGNEFFLKKRPGSKNIGETSFDNFAKQAKQIATFEPISHFQTTSEFTSNFHIPSPTNKQPETRSHVFTPDITIINNNVSHVVNNITHNHSAWANFRDARTPEFVQKNKSVSPLGRKDKVSAPKFIQQRKQEGKHNIKSFYASGSEKSSGIINTAPKPLFTREPQPQSFNSTHTSNNTNTNINTQESFKNAEMEWSGQNQRKPQKLYTFCRTINSKSPPKPFSNSFSPHSHTPFTPPASFQQSNTTSFFKKPSRTLTTEFNQPPVRMPSSCFPSENKSFTIEKNDRPDKSMTFQTQNQIQPRRLLKEKIAISQAIPQDVAESLPTSKSLAINAASDKSIQQNNLKRQLKLEFGSLLGSDLKLQKKEESSMETPPQHNLKDKIQQKKIAFAQLKKEALAVLTDIL